MTKKKDPDSKEKSPSEVFEHTKKIFEATDPTKDIPELPEEQMSSEVVYCKDENGKLRARGIHPDPILEEFQRLYDQSMEEKVKKDKEAFMICNAQLMGNEYAQQVIEATMAIMTEQFSLPEDIVVGFAYAFSAAWLLRLHQNRRDAAEFVRRINTWSNSPETVKKLFPKEMQKVATLYKAIVEMQNRMLSTFSVVFERVMSYSSIRAYTVDENDPQNMN